MTLKPGPEPLTIVDESGEVVATVGGPRKNLSTDRKYLALFIAAPELLHVVRAVYRCGLFDGQDLDVGALLDRAEGR